ncbi:MAG TPA: response regulator [Vicinamibacteria bacterium]
MADEGPAAQSLLIVEDDLVLRSRLAQAFRTRGFEVREAGDTEGALDLAREDPPEMALVDLRLPGASGLDAVRELLELDPATSVVVLTGYGSIATALEAMRLGATHYLTKPADVEEILAGFARAKAPDREGPAGVAPAASSTPTLARVEWEHINRVLADCGGTVSKAARALGIHRRSLQRKLSKFPSAR